MSAIGPTFFPLKVATSETRVTAVTTVTRRLCFAAGHRVFGHESKCAHPHGHNYVLHVNATADQLDSIGRVIDFGVIKARVGEWLEVNWDHAFLYFEDDREMAAWFANGKWRGYACPFNPTAENMATYLLHIVSPLLFADTGVRVVEIVLEETENCRATVRI